MDTKKSYIEWIDVAKGVGMILVIAGHTFCLGLSYPLYTFHLPLFFLLSGLVFNEMKYQETGMLIRSKAYQILRPWFYMALVSFLVCLCVPEWRQELSLRTILLELYTTNSNNIQNSSLWYLLCLYVMFLLYALGSRFKWIKQKNIIVLSIFAVVVLFLKHSIQSASEKYLMLPDNRLPFKMDTAMVALVFFLVGVWYKPRIKEHINKSYTWITLFLFFTIVYVAGRVNGWTNLNSFDFGRIPFLFYPIAFLGIYFVVCLSVKITNTPYCKKLKHLLVFYGKNSLVIFGFQSLFIRLYLYCFNHLQGLDMQLYQNYKFYHQIGAFFTVTFILCPSMVFMGGVISKQLNRLKDGHKNQAISEGQDRD